ncbi:hypothetical protein KAH81_00680 [bacterium]|nr:hypothetical protein [bacterium]
MVEIKLRQLLVILILTFSTLLFSAGQRLGTSEDFSFLPTDAIGEGTGDEAYIYSLFTMCPLQLELLDPTDTVWNVDFGTACWGCYAMHDTGFAFRNTGCIGANIKLAVESDIWSSSTTPPANPGFNKFLLWALAVRTWHTSYDNDDFWLDYDTNRTVCLIDTVPNYDKIASNRFYNYSCDAIPRLVPPMDATGMNLHPRKDFILLLLLQSPNAIDPEDTSVTIILHVVAEPIGG